MRKTILFFIGILLLTIGTRFTGLSWDKGQHLNPDERFLTMVAPELKFPKTIGEYFNTDTSPLNPHNKGFTFFVYGTWPMILVKGVGEALGKGGYDNLLTVGRITMATIDVFTACVVFAITKRIAKSNAKALMAFFFYAIMVLPIQQAHFFTVDSILTFCLAVTLLFLTFPINGTTGMLVGIAFGLSLATKISAAPVLAVIVIITGLSLLVNKKVSQTICFYLFFVLFSYCTLRVFLPYLFADSAFLSFHLNSKLMGNWKQLESFNDPKAWFPPGVQWIGTPPILYPLIQITFFGLGLPLMILVLTGVLWTVHTAKRQFYYFLPILFSLVIFLYEGVQYAKSMRYFLPMYPALAVTTGIFFIEMITKGKIPHDKKRLSIQKFVHWGLVTLLFLSFLWPTAFLFIYTKEHPRIAASNWIYTNIPSGTKLTYEHWDDPLPLNVEPKNNSIYTTLELPMYDPEGSTKWSTIEKKLTEADYIILSSNRVYGSIGQALFRYPVDETYYQALFNGRLGFTKVAEFTNRPFLPFPIPLCIIPPFTNYGWVDHAQTSCIQNGVSFVDDYADESFTVYDHPKVFIFKKTDPLKTQETIRQLISSLP